MKKLLFISILYLVVLTFVFPATMMAQMTIELSDEEVENIVRRSYPYVALYNINNKFAMDPSSQLNTVDGNLMNSMHDYVVRMDADSMPPAKEFWSLTLHDLENGFFIPNDHMKYSVGENAGMKLNSRGGIDIHVSVKKPYGVPRENWLPLNRGDYDIDVMMRIYDPDLKQFKTWSPPKVERTNKEMTK